MSFDYKMNPGAIFSKETVSLLALTNVALYIL